MTHNNNSHPVSALRQTSQSLREQTRFAQRQATTGANKARQASQELAALDMEKAFQQLRQMVTMVGGKPATRDDNVVAFPNTAPIGKAAE